MLSFSSPLEFDARLKFRFVNKKGDVYLFLEIENRFANRKGTVSKRSALIVKKIMRLGNRFEFSIFEALLHIREY